jgi:thiamine pyrophosphate-dependent acetolactate synthase large subunit-like protein
MRVADTVADVMVAELKASGLQRIYGIPGDSINGFTDVLRRDGGIAWEHVRHEECAAFAAAGQAAVTGQLAVAAGSCGPGNLADAPAGPTLRPVTRAFSRVRPDEASLARAAEVLNAGRRVTILAGAGCDPHNPVWRRGRDRRAGQDQPARPAPGIADRASSPQAR